MNRTKIEWCLNPDGTPGYTWNPITGCLNGCTYCYARKLANGRIKSRMLANDNIAEPDPSVDFDMAANGMFTNPFYPRYWPERMQELLSRNTACIERHPSARGIFVCSMSDLFGVGVPKEWTRQILQAIGDNAYDRFYLLTKQPQNLAKWSPFPANVYVGVTATTSAMAEEALYYLSQVEAAIKYISFEPLHEEITLDFAGIQWGIIGQQTKPDVPPIPHWVYNLVDCLDQTGAKVFIKDSLSYLADAESYPLRREVP